jgi:large subunit ribosomal protein L13
MKQTYFPSEKFISKKWYIVDATNQKLGRIATQISKILIGKHNKLYTPFLDTGDNIIIINTDKLIITGKKEEQKIYRNHSGQPGGMRIETFSKLKERRSEKILYEAVKGMLPKTSLGRKIYSNLRVYKNNDHPHHAQKPEFLEF